MINELQKPIFPLTSGQKTPAKNAVGFNDPANYEKLRSLCKPGENYGLLMGKNTTNTAHQHTRLYHASPTRLWSRMVNEGICENLRDLRHVKRRKR